MFRFCSDFEHSILHSEYVEWTKINGMGRNSHDQRFGQLICNRYLKQGQTFPELFYEENAEKAFGLAANEINIRINEILSQWT
jgi:hypothetical protein